METISEFKGLNGNIVAFKEAVGDVENEDFGCRSGQDIGKWFCNSI